jgi:hypothetical protein
MKIRKTHLLLSLTAASLIAAAANADTIVIDPDGSGNSPAIDFSTLNFGAGNILLQGAIPFTVKDTFQLLFQAQLNSVVTSNGEQTTPIGLNATSAVGGAAPFEITVVGSITEAVSTVTADNPARITFRVAGNQDTGSFVELYYDGAQNANPLQGTGYNDGTLILRGAPTPKSPNVGVFALSQPQPVTAPSFDLFGTNDYATGGSSNGNLTSVQGIGATRMDITVTFVNTAFFVAAGGGNSGRQLKIGDIVSLEMTHSVPFDKVDPSHKFVSDNNTGTGSGPAPAATPRLGGNNGSSGPDLQAQSMISASFKPGLTTPTPTPSTTPTPTASPSTTPTPTATATGTPSSARVVVSASATHITEGQDSIISFTLKGAPATHSAITVNYSVGGNATLNTDYSLSGSPGTVVIPANGTTATITLHSVTDTVKEPNGEAAKIFVEAGTGYNVPTQQDAKRASILIVDAGT